jgi:uncharacterized protein YhdP
MTEATRDPAAPPQQEGPDAPTHWVRRSLLVVFSLGLLAAVGVVFTQVIAARVPEQRATLEKLIADRTGLQVRFEDVHFAWTLDGTSAVFERVELTDPVRGRVRVVAPELRVEFDAWDFIRHQQFSLGHVTLSSPDIDIIGDAEPAAAAQSSGKSSGKRPVVAKTGQPAEDEAALLRRFTSWAELMPVGRVEVDGARVHLFRRGERVARHDFTLSQAVVSRGTSSFNAFGTMLLSQDLGQSLFVSAKLEGVGGQKGPSGELRLIARRVLLDKLPGLTISGVRTPALAARGRGTVDARLSLKAGRVETGQWQLSGREIELLNGFRFDHFTVNGALTRANDDVLLDFTDLQVTRGARLERTGKLNARVMFEPGSVRVANVTAQSDRVPFMAAELIAGTLSPALHDRLANLPADWSPTAGELRHVRIDSRAGVFSAQLSGAELRRAADGSRLSHLSAQIEIGRDAARIDFDGSDAAQVHLPGSTDPRALQLSGALELRDGDEHPELQFAALRLRSGEAAVVADGPWIDAINAAQPLALELLRVDRAMIGDAWQLLALEGEWPQLNAHLDDIGQGEIVTGKLALLPMTDDEGRRGVNWVRSRGTLEVANLATAGSDAPRLESAAGKLEFSRGGARLRLTSGSVEDLRVSDARLEWPRGGQPRIRAVLQGDLQSPLLSRTLQERGLRDLKGAVTVEAEARGEDELRDTARWRLSVRVSNASIPLASGLPPVEKLNGVARIANGQLRALTLEGSWLGGPVEIEARRAGADGISSATLIGTADAAPLLGLLGQRGAAGQVSGRLSWSGTLQRNEKEWQVTLASDLAGVESRLPVPFDKPRARLLPLSAGLRFDEHGIREFEIESGRDSIRGRVDGQVTQARFEVQGVSGELRTADGGEDSRLTIDNLDVKRAPAVLAAAGALLPADSEMQVAVADLRHARRGLGALNASLARRGEELRFSLESASGAPHEINANGRCESQGACRFAFSLQTDQLRALLGDAELPVEWPAQSLRASGELNWRADASQDITRALRGEFELETQGADSTHQLVASATLADGHIDLANVQGTGPGPDQVFRGQGRVGLLARTYDLSVDYERVSLAATGMPTPARARIARAWTALRGSAARQGWAETQPSRRVQWHGSWDGDSPHLPAKGEGPPARE